jgi:hypothetical protein
MKDSKQVIYSIACSIAFLDIDWWYKYGVVLVADTSDWL